MGNLLMFVGVVEAATGAALLLVPSVVTRLLLGAELAGVGFPVGRVAGIALFALGVGCWPGPGALGMLAYSILITSYLLYLGMRGEWVGLFLWPAVVIHGVLTLLLARRQLSSRR
jgi:hypothetical protein